MGKKNGQSWEDRALKDARELGVPMWTMVEDPGPGQTSTRVTMGVVTPKGVRSNTAGSHAGEDVAAEKAAKKTVGLLFRWSVARRAQGMPHPRPFWDWKKHSGEWLCFVGVGQGESLAPIGRGIASTKGEALEKALRSSSHEMAKTLLGE